MKNDITKHTKRIIAGINKAQEKSIVRWDYNNFKNKNWQSGLSKKIKQAFSKNTKFDCVLCSQECYFLISELKEFDEQESGNSDIPNKIGVFDERIQVYTDMYLPQQYILILKESDLLDRAKKIELDIIFVDNFDLYDGFKIDESKFVDYELNYYNWFEKKYETKFFKFLKDEGILEKVITRLKKGFEEINSNPLNKREFSFDQEGIEEFNRIGNKIGLETDALFEKLKIEVLCKFLDRKELKGIIVENKSDIEKYLLKYEEYEKLIVLGRILKKKK